MKKPVILFAAILLVAAIVFAAYFFLNGQPQPKTQNVPDKAATAEIAPSPEFSEEFKWTSELMEKYLSQENPARLAYAGPFYTGNFDGIQKVSQEYSKLRKEKVAELKTFMQKGIEKLNLLGAKMKESAEMRKWYLDEILKNKSEWRDALTPFIESPATEPLLADLANLNKLNTSTSSLPESAERGFFEYMIFGEIFRLTDEMTKNMAKDTADLGAIYAFSEKSGTDLADIDKELKDRINELAKTTDPVIQDSYYMTAVLNLGEKVLFTSDYNYAKEATVFIDKELAILKTTLDTYKDAPKPGISPLIVEVIQNKYQKYSENNAVLKKYLEDNAKNPLLIATLPLDNPHAFGMIPIALAYETDFFKSLHGKVEGAIKVVKNVKGVIGAGFQMAAEESRKLYDKSGAHEVVKDVGQIIGAGLDAANQTVELSVDAVQGVYYGDTSFEDIKNNVAQRKANLQEKFIRGTLGIKQYDQILTTVKSEQEKLGKAIEKSSEALGAVAEMGVSTVTGSRQLGKLAETYTTDISKDLFQEATAGIDECLNVTQNAVIALHPKTSKSATVKAITELGATVKERYDNRSEAEKEEAGDDDEEEEKGLGATIKEKITDKAKEDTGISAAESLAEPIRDPEKYFTGLKESMTDKIYQDMGDEFTKEKKEEIKMVGKILKKNYEKMPTEQELLEEFFDLVDKELAKDPKAPPEKSKEVSPAVEPQKSPTPEQQPSATIPPVKTEPSPAPATPPVAPPVTEVPEVPKISDIDTDGIPDAKDNCVSKANADQADIDKDGFGDGCDDINDNPVRATGSFSGDYEGDLTLNFKPTPGSKVTGTMVAPEGTLTIDGSVSGNRGISASLSGFTTYEIYDENGMTTASCQVTGSLNGTIGITSASGTYSGKCNAFKGTGTWSASW